MVTGASSLPSAISGSALSTGAGAASFAGAASSAAIATSKPTLFPPTVNGLKAKRAAKAIAPGAKTAILRFLYTGVSKLDPFRVVLERRKVNFKAADAEGEDLTPNIHGLLRRAPCAQARRSGDFRARAAHFSKAQALPRSPASPPF